MVSCVIPLVRKLASPIMHDAPATSGFPIELARELEILRVHSLTLLMAFLTIHETSASHVLAAVTLALLVYTINLHIAINNSLLQSCPLLSKFLHSIPVLGIICMAVFKFVIIVQSVPITAAVLSACALPFFVVAAHFVKRCARVFLAAYCANGQDSTRNGSLERLKVHSLDQSPVV